MQHKDLINEFVKTDFTLKEDGDLIRILNQFLLNNTTHLYIINPNKFQDCLIIFS